MTVMPCGGCGGYVGNNTFGTKCEKCGWKVGDGVLLSVTAYSQDDSGIEPETAWLIERSVDGSAEWLRCVRDAFSWTNDANRALRLSRKVDAEMLMGSVGLNFNDHTATEHMWHG